MRWIAGLVLWFVAGTSGAEWKHFKIIEEGSGDEKAVYYIKADSQEKTGAGYKLWYLVSYAKTRMSGTTAYQSAKVQEEFDCKRKRSQQIYWIAYQAVMGGGGIAGSESRRPWASVPSGSVLQQRMNSVCGAAK